jgi:spore coat protein CotH
MTPRTRPTRAHRRRPATHRLLIPLLAALLIASCAGGSADDSTDALGTADDAVEVFDPGLVHDISVSYDQSAYDEMIDAFATTGDKNWIEATVTVDGSTYERAGLRLKGNSSLMGLRQGGSRSTDTGGDEQTSTTGAPADGGAVPQPPGGPGDPGAGGFAGLGSGADASTPEELPWLIRLDEFVEGQRHQDHADIVVRSNSSATSLNEAVAQDLLDAAGLRSQLAAPTSFSVNGGDPVLRLAVENPDDDAWQDRSFDAPGALYKAESTGDWTYRGTDPDAYTDVFDQEGGKKLTDLTPLIEFLQFINESDDTTFAAELAERLDVDSFAAYLAMMDLMANTDDIDGPGNNAYIWWDEETGQMTIVPWDMNLAFGAMGNVMRGGVPGGGGMPDGFDPSNLPEGFDPGNLPDGATPPDGAQAPGQDGRAPGGMFGRNNILVSRFHANPEFEALYQQHLSELRAELFASGTAGSFLDSRVETLTTVPELVDDATLQGEANSLREQFETTARGS